MQLFSRFIPNIAPSLRVENLPMMVKETALMQKELTEKYGFARFVQVFSRHFEDVSFEILVLLCFEALLLNHNEVKKNQRHTTNEKPNMYKDINKDNKYFGLSNRPSSG